MAGGGALLLLLLGCCLVRRRRRRKQVARDANGGVEAKADGQPVNAQRPVPTDSLFPSTFPATLNIDPSTLPAPVLLWSQRQNGQGKLTESAESMSKAAHRAEINDTEAELAKMFARGAKGTKDGPGRLTSRSGTLPAHNPVQVPSSHPGPGCCSTGVDGTTTMNGASKDCVRCTNGLQASPPVPAMATQLDPRPRTPRDLWAAVRTRREAIQAINALREQGLADRHTGIREMREERTRRLSKDRWQRSQRSLRGLEGLSSGEGPIVRV